VSLRATDAGISIPENSLGIRGQPQGQGLG
jgi:hypothetical protein